ncbi:hypothetical protein ACLB2K_069003 [Fragaria x ananassa]
MFQVMKKIANTLMELNDWQRATFGNRKREIEGIQERLEQLLCLLLTANYLEEHSQLSNQLKNLLDEERNYWKQRSRVAWLNEGVRQGVEHVVIGYFKAMFATASIDQVKMHEVVNLLQPRVTDDMKEDLGVPYSDEEIKAALFQMYPTKSSGPDGMPLVFFQKYWDVIRAEVCGRVKGFLTSGQLLRQANYTHICLIPKVLNPTQVADLRPIALCNMLYKICSKVIANRLKRHLSDIISPFQSAFIPRRLITDNSLIANEVSHFIHSDSSAE